MRIFLLSIFVLAFTFMTKAQGPLAKTQATLALDSTRLPIVAMKLPFLWPPWDPIPDTPKVTVDMGIINYGYNVMNHITDPINQYKGKIGIEKRGSISQAFWYLQKSYGFETRDISGNDSDAVILGMPLEHDWILYAPYDDKTFMRNVLIYQLGHDMGYYTPRSKFCEVQFYDWAWTPDYRGVYVMMEKIKRDANRVNISKLTPTENTGDAVTGGYIFGVDRNIWANDSGWKSPYDTSVFFSYKYPKGDEITIQQKTYLKAYVDSFETALNGANFANPLTGYKKFIDHSTFIDFFFMQELSKSVDAFRRSAYMYKDKKSKGGKIKAGPLWDFNSSLYNAQLCTFEQDTGWAYQTTCWVNANYHVPFWWGKLLQDSSYRNEMKCRWMYLRSTALDTTHIFHIIDSVKQYLQVPSTRHFYRYDMGNTIQGTTDTLKWWIKKRLTWLDAHIPGNCITTELVEKQIFENSLAVYPNPTAGQLTLDVYLGAGKNMQIEFQDVMGRSLRKISGGAYPTGKNKITLDISEFPEGVYLLKVRQGETLLTRKVVLQK
jgi:hypothetical protein